MFNANIPVSFRPDAFSSASYIINRLPNNLLDGISPFELIFSQPPNYAHFRAYGCQVFPYLRDYLRHKLAPRSILCVFIGYNSQYNGFKCLDPITSRIYISRHARFNELLFPFGASKISTDLSTLDLTTFDREPPYSFLPSPNFISKPTRTNKVNEPPCSLCDSRPCSATTFNIPSSPNSSSSPSMSYIQPSPSPPNNPSFNSLPTQANSQPINQSPSTLSQTVPTTTHPITTRSKARIFKPKY